MTSFKTSAASTGGEMNCRVCGLRQDEAIWGVDGQSASFDFCACCGCELGNEDCSPEGVRRHREQWIAGGGTWFDPTKRPAGWTIEERLSKVPRFYFRVLPGLPGTGDAPTRFNVTGMGVYSEGFVVEFTCASGQKWVGNFQAGYGKSVVVTVPGRSDQVMVIAEGQAYVVEPDTRALIRTFGGQITDVFSLDDREAMIFGNGLWFECNGPEGLRWRTRRISWDGMMEVSLEGHRLHGSAFNPIDDQWSAFDVDIDTGEVTGGSYPPDLPQP